MSAYAWTVGVDWGGAQHHVTVLDSAGEGIRHTTRRAFGGRIAEAVRWILDVTAREPEAVAVAIETPRGVLVDSLLEQGFAVFAINPKQVDRFRDRFSAGGAKDDPRDARVLADALRTDAARVSSRATRRPQDYLFTRALPHRRRAARRRAAAWPIACASSSIASMRRGSR